MGRGLSVESQALSVRILNVFAQEHPNSPRRVAYALFGNQAGVMASKIGKLCGRLIERDELPLDWYDDSSRAYVKPYVVEDMDAMVDLNRGVPNFDPWASQPVRVVVWSEKAVGGTLKPVLDQYAVPFLNTSGWNSLKMMMEEARRARIDPRRDPAVSNFLGISSHSVCGRGPAWRYVVLRNGRRAYETHADFTGSFARGRVGCSNLHAGFRAI